MAQSVTFNNFNLQDANYITSELIYRSSPSRDVVAQKITRRPGVKYTALEFAERSITLTGGILGSSATDLQTKIDNLYNNVVRVDEGQLTIDTNRSINAFVNSIAIDDPHYSQSYVPFEIEFLSTEPFFKGPQQVMNLTVTSGVQANDYTTVISGSAYAEPVITYSAPTGTGDTTTAGIHIEYNPTGEQITWSGTGGLDYAQYSDVIQFDWPSQYIVRNEDQEEPSGVFARWEPGSTTFTVTFSGGVVGGSLQFAYQPRYF